MEIPSYIDKRNISYGWEGNDEVTVFSAAETLDEFKRYFDDSAFVVDRLIDCETSINYLFRTSADVPAFQVFAAIVDCEEEHDLDIMAYVGEDEFTGLDMNGARLIGTFFKLSAPPG